MTRKTYLYGDGHTKWGIYNTAKKEFQFGICEDSPKLAEDKLFQKIGNNARKWRFVVKPISMIPKYAKSGSGNGQEKVNTKWLRHII